MPKKPSPALIAKWRELRAEGKSFSQIGKDTGTWQGRTVKKYVGQDLASREGGVSGWSFSRSVWASTGIRF